MTTPATRSIPELSTAPGGLAGRFREPIVPVLVLLAAIISIHITLGEFHFNGDEMRHAVTGVFFRDAFVDRPFHHPMQYVREYYAKYPALGIPHWPPLFHFVEGIFFLIFGLSPWASRLCVLSFSLLGAYFWYRIAERQGPRHLAWLSALIFPLMPFVLTYERATMLEVPMMALTCGAVHFWRKYVERERPLDIWLMTLFGTAAFLTSQKAMFVPVFLGLHFLMTRAFRVLRHWQFWAALVLSGAAVVPWYLMSLGTLTLSYERVTGESFKHMYRQWQGEMLFYPVKLLEQLPLFWVLLGASGFVWALVRRPRRHAFLLLWVATTYAVFTLTQEKDTRHTMIWIPALIYLALAMVQEALSRGVWARVALAALAVYAVVSALEYDRPRLWGVEQAARYVTEQPESQIIYYQGNLNGDFIFYVRKFDPEKTRMVAREKQAVATKIVSGYGTREILTEPQDVLEFFRTWGIRYAVIENREFIHGLGPVRKVLQSDAFEQVASFPVGSNNPAERDRRLTVYRFRGPLERATRSVTIPMMTIRDDIRADLSRLAGRPWPN